MFDIRVLVISLFVCFSVMMIFVVSALIGKSRKHQSELEDLTEKIRRLLDNQKIPEEEIMRNYDVYTAAQKSVVDGRKDLLALAMKSGKTFAEIQEFLLKQQELAAAPVEQVVLA